MLTITITIFLYSCHKEDSGRYAMDKNTFVSSVILKSNYQLEFITRLANGSGAVAYANKRKAYWNAYIKDLRCHYEVIPNIFLSDLSSEDTDVLNKIDKSSAEDGKKITIEAILQSDQDLIAIHIRAVSNSGIDNAVIRN